MIPYVELAPLHLPAGISIEPYGALVVTALSVGLGFGWLRAPRHGVARTVAIRGLWWAVVCGLVAAHVGHLLISDRARLAVEGAAALLDVGSGLSSIAGIAAGLATLLVWSRIEDQPALRMFDLLTESFVSGWIFGRLGCALVHDHPGSLSSFPLAVAYPDGARHDLGLYELLFTLGVLVPVLWRLARRRAPTGTPLVAFLCLYGPGRFALDFLRASDLPGSDPRYAGLTAAQYGAVAMFALGLGLLAHLRPLWRRAPPMQ